MVAELKLIKRTDTMTEDVLREMGVYSSQIEVATKETELKDEIREALVNADSVIVGPDTSSFVKELRHLTHDGIFRVNEDVISVVETIDNDASGNKAETLSFLKNNKGNDVFLYA
jgi:hypothetical protein